MKKAETAFEKKLGKKLYNGTLNVKLEQDYVLKGTLDILKKEEYGGDQNVYIKACEVLGHKSYIVRTEKNSNNNGDHPLCMLEIISDICFREVYNLKDEETVEIKLED